MIHDGNLTRQINRRQGNECLLNVIRLGKRLCLCLFMSVACVHVSDLDNTKTVGNLILLLVTLCSTKDNEN